MEMSENSTAKIEDFLEVYKNMNSSSYPVLQSALAKIYFISNDGTQKLN